MVLHTISNMLAGMLMHLFLAKRDLTNADKVLDKLNQADAFNMVLLDMVMPRLSGREKARKIRQLRPDIPVIFTTGHDASSAIREVEMFDKMFVCEKPFKLKVFSWKMQTLLNAS